MNAQNLFYRYQWEWLANSSPFKIGMWARQTGKDYTCAAEAILDCIKTPHNHWLIIACGERQAIESLQHAKFLAERLCKSEINYHKSEILFRNGSRITALPAKPETIRGYSANLILTEFAFHDHSDEIWRSVFPILTNPLRGGAKKLRIISTPNGHSNRFHSLWHTTDNTFFKQKVTIHDAVAAGLPINIPLLQRGLADTEAFAQEYECQFLDQSTVLLPYDLIATCESSLASETSTPAILSTHPGEKFLGIDFGRKHDLTVAWLLEKLPLNPNLNLNPNLSSPSAPSAPSAVTPPSIPNHQFAMINNQSHLFLTREVLILRNASTPEQLEALIPRIHLARRVCLDYTGPGIGLGDLLARQFGEFKNGGARLPPSPASSGRIELCTFTQPLKNELFTHLRSAFERRLLAIPDSTDIREDLHSIYRIISNNGQISYRASHSPDGHSDRCTALALALRAAESAPITACASSVSPPRRLIRRHGRHL